MQEPSAQSARFLHLFPNRRIFYAVSTALAVAITLLVLTPGFTAGSPVAAEAETNPAGGATVVNDATASGGKALAFGTPNPSPNPNPTPGGSLLKSTPTFTKRADLRYSSASPRLLLDLYTPNHNGPFPLIVWVHGGGWSGGSKTDCFPERTNMIQRGFAVACINYRLSNEAKFPAQIQDVKAAIRWLRANGSTYNLFTNKIGMWGNSAGGHLVAMAGTTGNTAQFDTGANLNQSSAVQAVVDYWGPTDFIAFAQTPGYTSHGGPQSAEAALIGGPVLQNLDKARAANPITYINTGDAPHLIYHGSNDGTVPLNQSQLLHDALRRNNINSTYHVIQGAGHNLDQFRTSAILNEITTFYDEILR